jgi:ABC-type lipoprotein export system ATPase subunit
MLEKNILDLINNKPYIKDFFESFGLPVPTKNQIVKEYFNNLNENLLEDLGQSKEQLLETFIEFEAGMNDLLQENDNVNSLTIIGGQNKLGEPENFTLTIKKSEIYSIVGPTGSGKSRLLADIEWVAQCDTPTKRKILINNEIPDKKWRFSTEHKLVAQLSQNMNFVIDLTVEEFIRLHAESRFTKNLEEKVKLILEKANELAGESFSGDTPITSLSGGQSRSLMIADTAYLSKSPVILIDEIENAGIDRKKALELLTGEEKIVLMATHDPILALMADKRLVIKNGGVIDIIETSKAEKNNLIHLQELDNKLLNLRNMIRQGKTIDFEIN